MKFDVWNHIYESLSNYDLTATAEALSKELEEDFGVDFYVIPQFEKFTRPDEPTQIGYLLTNDNLRSMRLNFTEEDGELFSVDYWRPDSVEPSITVYLNDLPFERAIAKLLAFYKNPSISTQVKEDEESDVTVTKPAPSKEADKKVIVAQHDYEFGDPDEVFSDLQTYVDMVLEGEMNSLIVTGQSGVGKTYLVLQRLEEKGLKRNQDFFKITGKSTAAGMYISMYEHNGKILLYDDCDSIFNDVNAINVLKGGLDTTKVREISWNSAAPLKTAGKSNVAKTFDFTGKIIFISNLSKKKVAKALQSRAFMLEIALTKEDMISRMWTLLPKVEIPSGAVIKGAMKNKAMNLLIQAAEEYEFVELNMRTLLKAIAIANRIPKESTALRLIKQQCA
jgi:hypothetical protein